MPNEADQNKPVPRFDVFVFTQSNPLGPQQDDLADLLRRVADSIEDLGAEFQVHDIVMHTHVTADGLHRPSIKVYFAD